MGTAVLTVGVASSALTGVARAASGIQYNWAYCSKCRGLFYKPNQLASFCPGGGQHNGADSNNYSLFYGTTDPRTQSSWRWCDKCEGLFYGPKQSASYCPEGFQHDGSKSNDYDVFVTADLSSAADYQIGWKYCINCRGLFYGPKQYESICPKPGTTTHNDSGSWDYAL